MTAIICIMILAYCIIGKDIRSLLEKVKDVDCWGKANELYERLKTYAIKVGRVAAKPLLQFYYAINDKKHLHLVESSFMQPSFIQFRQLV